MVNRIHPESMHAVSPAHDFYTMDRSMRELEIRFGRAHAPGPYVVVERNGRKVVERVKNDPDKPKPERRPQGSERMEEFAGEESLFTFARGEPRKRVVRLLKEPALTWARLHTALASYGLELRPKGAGLAVYALAAKSTTPIKASDLHENLSLVRLERQLGPYEAPARAPGAALDREKSYTPDRDTDQVDAQQPRSKRDPVQREERKQARAEARRDLKLRYTTYRNGFVRKTLSADEVKARYKLLADTYVDLRAGIRQSKQPALKRKAAYSLLAAKAASERRALQLAIKREREDLNKGPENKPLTFRDWVHAQAQSGDTAALAQLRGWHYAEQRSAKATAAPADAAHSDGAETPNADDAIDDFTFDKVRARQVLRNGAVVYWQNGERSFIDYGRIIRMAQKGEPNDEHILAALTFARQKLGGSFRLTGTDEFKARAIELIAKHKIDIKLTDSDQVQGLNEAKSRNAPKGPKLK
jgi:hypothetical protein